MIAAKNIKSAAVFKGTNVNKPTSIISAVPTNIITGFLGVGKTTVILNLLKNKPSNERWAVLVNEFGEVGVDGSLMQGNFQEDAGIFIREVPGGCMCCAAGLPMQIALNQLLSRAKPDRLLIEPTGLGHPREVLEVLSAQHYREILEIQTSITLVDARKVSDPRYTQHDTFNQQIDIADVIVGHKTDLYGPEDKQHLTHYLASRRGNTIPLHFIQYGELDVAVLAGKSKVVAALIQAQHQHTHNNAYTPAIVKPPSEQTLPDCGYLKIENQGEGYNSVGWRFSPDKIFNKAALFAWVSGLEVERAKAVFITNEGVFAYNVTQDALTEMELDDCLESRIEMITHGATRVSEADLLQCIEA